MKPNFPRDPLSTLRHTIHAMDHDPEPLTPQLVALRQLLETRLSRLEAEQHQHAATPLARTAPE